MDASQVAGLLILLGVVGVLAAIVGSGIEAGPVKFPSIPGSRQKPLAVASAVVILGGSTWWAIQQSGGSDGLTTAAVQTLTKASGKLRLSLIPARSNIRLGSKIVVSSEVYNSLGQELGSGECDLSWSDALSNWNATTPCIAKVSEPDVVQAGVHEIIARAQGRGGLLASGAAAVKVTVRR